DVAGQAPRLFAEIKVQEHNDGHDHENDQAGVAEVKNVGIDVEEREEVDQRIHAGHSVDAIHETERIHRAHPQDKDEHHQPRRFGHNHTRLPHDQVKGDEIYNQPSHRIYPPEIVQVT